MNFDIPTVLQLAASMSFLIGCGLAYAAIGYPAELQRAIDPWLRGLIVLAVAFVLMALRERLHEMLSIVVANGLLVGAFAAQTHALRELYGQPRRTALFAAIVVTVLIGEAVFIWIWPSPWAATVLVSAFIGLFCTLGVATVRSAKGMPSRSEQMLVLLLGVGMVVMVACVLVLPGAGRVDPANYPPVRGTVFTYATLLPVFTTIAFMLICGERLREDLSRLAKLDPLTGVPNRRTLDDLGQHAVHRARNKRRPLALLTLDIDHFKQINDAFGHEGGDIALRALVDLLRTELRTGDVVSRIGGEEFVIILPDVDEDGAHTIAERIRARVEDASFKVDDRHLPMRVSIGAGALGSEIVDFDALRQATDRALYAAKRGGRNRVVRLSELAMLEGAAPP